MINIDLIKNAVGLVVGFGVSEIVGGFVDLCCPNAKGIKKAAISITTGVISGYCGAVLGEYAGNQLEEGITQIQTGIEAAKTQIEKMKAQEQEAVNG